MSRSSRAIRGFKAWCDEFVSQVLDTNGMSIWSDFDEQLGSLQDNAEPRAVEIPDIMTDEDAVKVIDELLYRLKRCNKSDANPLCLDLHLNLKEMVKQWNLDQPSDADIDAPEGWDVEPGQGVVLAIADSGIDSDHPDLAKWLLEQGISSVSLNPDTVIDTWLFMAGQQI